MIGELSTGGHLHEAVASASRAQVVRADPGVSRASHPASSDPASSSSFSVGGGHGDGPAQQGRADPDVAAVCAADDAAAHVRGDTAAADDARHAAAGYIH